MIQKVVRKQNNSKMCFICGMKNDFGLKASFFELYNGLLVASFTPCKFHQGYPGRLHGGIASAILDEAMGRTILMVDDTVWGVTVELNVKFRKPIPLNNKIRVLCKLTNDNSRLFEAEGKIISEEEGIAVTAYGKYIKLPINKITEEVFIDDQWFEVKNENDPDEFELPDKLNF